MPRRDVWVRGALVLGLVLALTPGGSHAQNAPKAGSAAKARAKAQKPAAEPAPKQEDTAKVEPTTSAPGAPTSGFLGDPKKFTRFGGWGSMGGTIGQFGFARSALVTMPPVQEELKLTAEQKEKLRDWQENLRKRGEEMGRGFRNRPPGGEAGEGANGNPDGEAMNRPGDVPIAARIFQFTQMLNQVGAMVRENEDGLARILKTSQRKRLDQISLQMEGAAAVVRPEVAQAINLGEDQAEMIQQILAQSRLTQMASWVEQGRAMSELAQRRRPGAPGRPENGPQPAEGQEPGQSPPAEPGVRGESGPPGEPNAEPGPRRPRRDPEMEKAFRKQFETMRERGDAIQSRTTQAILKVLTRRQRASLDRLLGPPFDPAKVNNLGPPGARPAPKTDADR